MKEPLISVIVPIYKVENYLDRCIESIVKQTYRNMEIILVDDGSPDNCPIICDEWERKDSRIVVLHKVNGGLSDARNAGVKIASGDYIAFIDSDDWIEYEFIEKLYSAIMDYDSDFSGCKFRECESMCENICDSQIYQVNSYDTISGISALIDNRVRQVVWNKLYKKTLIENIEFEKGKYHEDEFWSYQVFAKSKRYVESDYVGYNYFQRENSIMGEKYTLKRLDAIEAKVYRQIFLEKNFPELAFQGKVNLLFSCMAQGQAAVNRLQAKEKEYALTYLKKIVKDNKLKTEDYTNLKLTHKMWMLMINKSLVLVCRIRNLLNIGY